MNPLNLDFGPGISQQVFDKIQNGDFSNEVLTKLTEECQESKDLIQQQMEQIEYDFVNNQSDQPIYEFQLDNMEQFLSNMQADSWQIVDTDQISKKVMKFLEPNYDLTQTQLKAMQIMDHLYCQQLPISVDDLQKMLRVLSVSWNNFHNFEEALHLVRLRIGYLRQYKQTPDYKQNIIEFIDRCDPINIIYDLMLKDLYFNRYLSPLLLIVQGLIHQFKTFIQDLDKDGKYLGPEFQESMTRKIIKALDILSQQKFNSESVWLLNSYGFQSFSEFSNLPLISIEIEKFYKQSYPIQFELSDLQDEVSHKFYHSNLLNCLVKIFEDEHDQFIQRIQGVQPKFRVFDAIQIITMMIGHLSLEDFESKVIPFLKFRLDKKQVCRSQDFQPETTFILSFIHTHSDENLINLEFYNIFCKNQIFDKIVNLVESTAKDICYQKFLWNQQIKDRNLFWLTVTSFELIKICKIITHSNCEIHHILSNSMKVISSIEKEEWPIKVLESMMNEMNEREKQNNRPHLTLQDRNFYHADYF